MALYKNVTEQEFNQLESQWKEDSRSIPADCFVAKCKNGYLAMDNRDSNCWTESFGSKVLVEEFFMNNLGLDDDYQNFELIHKKVVAY